MATVWIALGALAARYLWPPAEGPLPATAPVARPVAAERPIDPGAATTTAAAGQDSQAAALAALTRPERARVPDPVDGLGVAESLLRSEGDRGPWRMPNEDSAGPAIVAAASGEAAASSVDEIDMVAVIDSVAAAGPASAEAATEPSPDTPADAPDAERRSAEAVMLELAAATMPGIEPELEPLPKVAAMLAELEPALSTSAPAAVGTRLADDPEPVGTIAEAAIATAGPDHGSGAAATDDDPQAVVEGIVSDLGRLALEEERPAATTAAPVIVEDAAPAIDEAPGIHAIAEPAAARDTTPTAIIVEAPPRPDIDQPPVLRADAQTPATTPPAAAAEPAQPAVDEAPVIQTGTKPVTSTPPAAVAEPAQPVVDEPLMIPAGTQTPVATPPAVVAGPTQPTVDEATVAQTVAPAAAHGAATTMTSPPSAETAALAARLVTRGEEFMGEGDVAAARLFFERGAKIGSAPAMRALARTFDPEVLRQRGVVGIQPDPARAKLWYDRAKEAEGAGAQGVPATAPRRP